MWLTLETENGSTIHVNTGTIAFVRKVKEPGFCVIEFPGLKPTKVRMEAETLSALANNGKVPALAASATAAAKGGQEPAVKTLETKKRKGKVKAARVEVAAKTGLET